MLSLHLTLLGRQGSKLIIASPLLGHSLHPEASGNLFGLCLCLFSKRALPAKGLVPLLSDYQGLALIG